MKLDYGFITDRGRTRSHNQDFVGVSQGAPAALLASKGRLLVVADGFGKNPAGLQASQAAVEALTRAYYGDGEAAVARSLARAVQQANSAARQAAASAAPAQAGTTLTAAVVHNGALTVAHVGDSRAYLLHAGQLTQLTRDHSWAAEQVRAGQLTAEQAQQHPKGRNLARALGIQATVDVDLATQPLAPGDVLLLCSDGLTDQVGEAEIDHALQAPAMQGAAQRLVDLANQHGGGDNVAVVAARVGAAPSAAGAWLPWAIVGGAVGLVLLLLALLGRGQQPQQVAQGTPAPGQGQPAVVTVTVAITQAVPAATSAPGATAPLPAETPSAPGVTPSPLGAPTPGAPGTLAPVYPAPALLGPADASLFRGRQEQIRLQWQAVGTLGPDDHYVVLTEFPRADQVWRDEQQTRETELVLPAYLFDLATGAREFTWRVVVWRNTRRTPDNHLTGIPVSPESMPRRMVWLAETVPAPTSVVPPTPIAPPTPVGPPTPIAPPTALPTALPTPIAPPTTTPGPTITVFPSGTPIGPPPVPPSPTSTPTGTPPAS
jgi:protein phosphatase